MIQETPGDLKLRAFYAEAEVELTRIASKHGLSLPKGHARVDVPMLHWRLSVYDGSPEAYWDALWRLNAQTLGLGLSIEPGDVVLDQEGRTWTLLGLDPSGVNLPVRLQDVSGEQSMATLEAASMFQLLVKKDRGPIETG